MGLDNLVSIKQAQADKVLSSIRHKEGIAHTDNVSQTILSATSSLIQYLEGHTTKTEVQNQIESISTPDVKYVVEALQVLDNTLQKHENTDLSGVTALMQELVAEAKQLPKTLPDAPEIPIPIDYTPKLEGLVQAMQAVEKVVKEQKLVAEAPIVNVPETKVQVDAPNLAPLQAGFQDVVTAVKKIVIPEYKTDNVAVEKLLKDANKLLDKILKKPVSGGGGGGGRATPYQDSTTTPAFVTLNSDGSIPVSNIAPIKTATSTGASISASTNNTVVLALNTSRKMATFYNNSTATMYLKLGITASTSSFTIKIVASGYYELFSPIYTGQCDAVWDAAVGTVRVTEFT